MTHLPTKQNVVEDESQDCVLPTVWKTTNYSRKYLMLEYQLFTRWLRDYDEKMI